MPGNDPVLRVEAARVAQRVDSELILALSDSDLLTHRSHCESELDSAEKVRERWPALYRSGTPPLRVELAQINAELARRILSGDHPMPKILDRAVSRIESRGVKASSAYPIAVASLQKAGDLKPGTLAATAKGVKRGAMTAKQRAATR